MTIREIVLYPDPVLKQKTELVSEFDDELGILLDDMRETMYDANGIGLAAPQIGILKRVTVIDVSDDGSKVFELINAEILSGEGSVSIEEGCLSIPEYRESVTRKERITVKAQDRKGEEIQFEADDLLAICIQHELDHLDGVLFIDHLSRLKREMFKRWYKKHILEAS